MAGVEQCTAAIGSAFQGGAELMQAVRERKSKSRLQQNDQDSEQEYGEKMLHRALVNSAERCLRGSEERKYRFGSSFSVGDNLAMSELSLVMVNLQMQVTSTLQQMASATDVTFDLARLHEAVITAKSNTLRSMDELCQRIVYGTKKDGMSRHSESLLNLAHQDTSLFSMHDSVADHRSRTQHNAMLPLEVSKPRIHTMAGIAESVPAFTWPTTSTASSCRSFTSSDSSLSCRSSLSSPVNPPPTPKTTHRRQSIPEATPVIDKYEPILRRKSMRSAFLRSPSKPTLKVPVVHPAYREKLHITSTTALLAERPDHIWSPITTAFKQALSRVTTRCKKLGA